MCGPYLPKYAEKMLKPYPYRVFLGAESISEVKFILTTQQNLVISIIFNFLNIFA
jgi:hypothetical protein